PQNFNYGTTILEKNKWYFLTGTYDGTVSRIYVNGAMENSAEYTMTQNSSPLFIGDHNDRGRGMNGVIDDVKIYNYARTPAQIAYDYNRGAPVAWYRFDECEGTTIKEHSGNGNNGTLNIGSLGSQSSLGTCADGSSASA